MGKTQEQRAEQQDRMARAALPRLDELADQLEAVASEVFAGRVPYEPDVGADVMALSFATKQREHLRSVRTLIAAGQQRDALLIARTMLEGLGRLLWAFRGAPEGTELWLWFGAVLDWRQTRENEAAGLAVDPVEKIELKKLVDEHGPDYYRDAVRRSLKAAEEAGTPYVLPDDPWRTNWTDATIESMFAEVRGQYLYDGVYRDTSEWVHWGPRSILRAMEPADWGIRGFADEDWRAATSAMVFGCLSLLQSLEVLDRHFSLGRAARLAELAARMNAIRSESVAAGG